MVALSLSKQDNEQVRAEKEELLKELVNEKQKLKDLKEDIQQFNLVFSERARLQVSLYAKIKAMMENINTLKVPCDG